MYCKSYRSLGKLLGGDRDHHGHAMWVKVVKERQRKDCVVGVRETFQVRLVGRVRDVEEVSWITFIQR